MAAACAALVTGGLVAEARAEVSARSNVLGIADRARAPSDGATDPASPSAAPSPADATSAPDRVDDEPVALPMGGWTDLSAGCRIVTTFSSSGEGCGLGVRTGRTAYFHAGAGFFTTPQFERYVRQAAEEGSSSSSSPSDAARPGATIIDPARGTVYFLELGPGVAFFPTRQLNVHIEGGGFMGAISNPASLALRTSDSTGFVLGVFAGAGASYRIPSHPWAIGFDYRIQGIPYGGLGSGEEVESSGVEVGHSLFGFGHSFGLSAIVRFEDDRSN